MALAGKKIKVAFANFSTGQFHLNRHVSLHLYSGRCILHVKEYLYPHSLPTQGYYIKGGKVSQCFANKDKQDPWQPHTDLASQVSLRLPWVLFVLILSKD